MNILVIIFQIIMGFHCFFNGKTLVLGYIGAGILWVVASIEIYYKIKQLRGE